MKLRLAVGLAALLVLLNGCGSSTWSAGLSRLDDAEARWRAAGIANYHFTLTTLCFCPYRENIVVTVRDGQFSAAHWELSGTPLDPADLPLALTVADLFATLRDAYTRHAASVAVDYSSAEGYPKSIDIDYDAQAADEEIGYRATDFARD